MTERDQTQPVVDPHDEDPIGQMELPSRSTFGARAIGLLGSSVGLGVMGVIGMAATLPTTPPATK